MGIDSWKILVIYASFEFFGSIVMYTVCQLGDHFLFRFHFLVSNFSFLISPFLLLDQPCAIGFESRQYIVLWPLARARWFWLAATWVAVHNVVKITFTTFHLHKSSIGMLPDPSSLLRRGWYPRLRNPEAHAPRVNQQAFWSPWVTWGETSYTRPYTMTCSTIFLMYKNNHI